MTGIPLGALGAEWAPIFAATLAGLVAAITLAVNVTAARRDRRRHLYSDAYKATMSWIEMAYRAHHARPDDDGRFLDAYHKLWEDVRYFQGWLLMESTELGYSFAQFKEAVQNVCERVIETEWLVRTTEAKPLDVLPVEPSAETFRREQDRFLQDARDQLSPNPLTRATMRRRVRRRIAEEGGARVSGLPVDALSPRLPRG
jgi:biopolymer transport protein ExbB/TolQ